MVFSYRLPPMVMCGGVAAIVGLMVLRRWVARLRVIINDSELNDAYLDTRTPNFAEAGARLAELRIIVREGLGPPGSAAGLSPIYAVLEVAPHQRFQKNSMRARCVSATRNMDCCLSP